jgi:hypothetical protein
MDIYTVYDMGAGGSDADGDPTTEVLVVTVYNADSPEQAREYYDEVTSCVCEGWIPRDEVPSFRDCDSRLLLLIE